MSKQREQHVTCNCTDEQYQRNQGKCACRAKDCKCAGCSGARKARGHEVKGNGEKP